MISAREGHVVYILHTPADGEKTVTLNTPTTDPFEPPDTAHIPCGITPRRISARTAVSPLREMEAERQWITVYRSGYLPAESAASIRHTLRECCPYPRWSLIYFTGKNACGKRSGPSYVPSR